MDSNDSQFADVPATISDPNVILYLLNLRERIEGRLGLTAKDPAAAESIGVLTEAA